MKGVSVGVLGGKGQASESCKSQKGTGLKVSQSWRLEKPSTRGERIQGDTEKSPPWTPAFGDRHYCFPESHFDDLRGLYFRIIARAYSKETEALKQTYDYHVTMSVLLTESVVIVVCLCLHMHSQCVYFCG